MDVAERSPAAGQRTQSDTLYGFCKEDLSELSDASQGHALHASAPATAVTSFAAAGASAVFGGEAPHLLQGSEPHRRPVAVAAAVVRVCRRNHGCYVRLPGAAGCAATARVSVMRLLNMMRSQGVLTTRCLLCKGTRTTTCCAMAQTSASKPPPLACMLGRRPAAAAARISAAAYDGC